MSWRSGAGAGAGAIGPAGLSCTCRKKSSPGLELALAGLGPPGAWGRIAALSGVRPAASVLLVWLLELALVIGFAEAAVAMLE